MRESHRDDGNGHFRTPANLAHWSKEKIATLDAALRGGRIMVDGEFDILPGRARGNVHAVLGAMLRLKLETILGNQPSPERSLAMVCLLGGWASLVHGFPWPESWQRRSGKPGLGEELNVVNAPVESLNAPMDQLVGRQDVIKKNPAKHHPADGALIRYDMTTFYLEVSNCELGRHGHPKEGRPNKFQIQVGSFAPGKESPCPCRFSKATPGRPLPCRTVCFRQVCVTA